MLLTMMPPRSGQLGGQHALIPKRTPEVLVMREDSCMMSQRPAHDAEASTSRAAPPAFDVAVVHPKQELRCAGALPAHFDEAQSEQALWKEFRDYGSSINNMLTEALRIHGGPSIRIFQ
jgi:hypothetical protein